MSKQKKNSRRHSRIRFPFPALNIGNIIFGALFFYMAVSLFFYLTADHIKSFQVVQGTLSRNDTYTAFAMRTESVQLSSGSGYVQFYTPNASKISRGSAISGRRMNRRATFLVFSVTGSFKLPPAGDTVPMKVMEPVSPLFSFTYPARP